MKAILVTMTPEHLNIEALKQAGQILKDGGLVAFPTETVYGLGGNALDPKASMKIYAAKGRPSDNPLIVHIADLDQGQCAGRKILAGTFDHDFSENRPCSPGDHRRPG